MTFCTTDFYRENRQKLAEIVAHDAIIVVAGNGLVQRGGDTNYRFHQDSNMRYLTGLDEPDLVLVIDTSHGAEYIGLPKRTKTEILFGGGFDAEQITSVSGVATVLPVSDILDICKTRSSKLPVYYNMPAPRRAGEHYTNPARKSVLDSLRRRGMSPKDIRPLLAGLRSVKQPVEIQAIEAAIRYTHEALQLAQKQLHHGSEQALQVHIDAHFARHSLEHAYQPIVASGRNATTLHYVKNNASFSYGEAVLFDVGAEVEGYAADISRTYVYGQNDRAQAVIDAVGRVQQAVIGAVKPGATWKGLSQLANDHMRAELAVLELPSTDVRTYFPHAFGHFLGLDVHDVGDYTKPLEPGIVLTVEPGIYIAAEGIGVRIEDDIVVTSTGARVLGS